MKFFRPAAIALLALLFTVSVMVEPASAIDGASVGLAWDPSPDPGVAGYRVYRTETPVTILTPPLNGSTLVTATSFTDSTVQSGHTYYYIVTAVSSTGLESTRSNAVQTTVVAPAPAPLPPPLNLAPAVSAGADRTITLPASANLTAIATDDGLPNGQLTYRWSQVQGSPVTFTSPLSATTQISFPGAGAYTLRATATDGQLASSDDVVITVQSATNRAPNGEYRGGSNHYIASVSKSDCDRHRRRVARRPTELRLEPGPRFPCDFYCAPVHDDTGFVSSSRCVHSAHDRKRRPAHLQR